MDIMDTETHLKKMESVTQNLMAHCNDLESLKEDIAEIFTSIHIWLTVAPRDTLVHFVRMDVISIIAKFVRCQDIDENERLKAVTFLCLMLEVDTDLKLGVVNGNFRRMLIEGLSQLKFQRTIANTIARCAAQSEKFRNDVKNDAIEEKIMDLALIVGNGQNFSEVIQMIGAIYNPTKSYELFQETEEMKRVDFIHALVWMLNDRFQHAKVTNGEATLERYMPILTEALQENPGSEGKVAGMACLVLRHFFVHDSNSCAETVIRADLVPHIVNLLSCSNVTVILQTSKCITYLGKNPSLCKLFIEKGVITRLKEKIDSNPINARIFGPVCFALRGISDGLAQEELSLIPLDILERVQSLSNVSKNPNVKKIANFFLDSMKKRLSDGLVEEPDDDETETNDQQ